MERNHGLWHFNEKSADRLWHKSAIGKPAEGGGIYMNTAELLFCINHRNIDSPKGRLVIEELEENPNFLVQYAAMEAVRIPGNKVVLNIDQWSSIYDFEKNSWAMRWPSNLHPRDDEPISELQIFNSNDVIVPEELYSWCREVEQKGLIPEIIGRLPVLSFMNPLDKKSLKSILTLPKNALIKQYQGLFKMDNVELIFTEGALDFIVDKAFEYNLGARGLRSLCESVLNDAMFDLPNSKIRKIKISKLYVEEKLSKVKLLPLRIVS